MESSEGTMSIMLTVDNDTAGVLVEKLTNDPYFLAAAYGPQRENYVGDIHPNTLGILEAVANNTWLHNRDDQPGEPVAAVIQCDLKAKTATVTFHPGDEAEAWRFNDSSSMDLRAALAP